MVFAVDISKSMTLKDVKPSRLNLAKGFCEFLTVKLSNASCALLAVKGDSVLSVPLTFEHEVLLKAIESLSPSSYTASGTNLQKALLKAAAVFPKNRATAKNYYSLHRWRTKRGKYFRSCKRNTKARHTAYHRRIWNNRRRGCFNCQ
ncbi:VWA domain-containing protein [Treponema phagedenis]|nr:VWA domain-containing protein [Treponema phagedenis]QLC60173.1 VWA domain-containing protein [Treponema phagedenis]